MRVQGTGEKRSSSVSCCCSPELRGGCGAMSVATNQAVHDAVVGRAADERHAIARHPAGAGTGGAAGVAEREPVAAGRSINRTEHPAAAAGGAPARMRTRIAGDRVARAGAAVAVSVAEGAGSSGAVGKGPLPIRVRAACDQK